MIGEPALISVRLNKGHRTQALVDTGCDFYAIVDESLARKLRLPLVDRSARPLRGFAEGVNDTEATGVARISVEISGHAEELYAYVVRGLDQDLFLGKPWFEKNQILYDAAKRRMHHGIADVTIHLTGQEESGRVREIRAARVVAASTFAALCRRIKRSKESASGWIRAISISDINKALQKKADDTLLDRVPEKYRRDFGELFSAKAAAKLPPHRPGIDHKIELIKNTDGMEPSLPWGPLYSMSREELLVLRKVLNDLLDKGFIRASSSEAAAPVLFVRKGNGGLRLCCDYRALNAITRRDRYPLPLISETLRNLARARWFTKLDVTAAFHKIRMAEGHEGKTAFRTRYGLFEWLVCPFGLNGAPATFQRYINITLKEFLDIFVTAYMDNILIYSSGSRRDHEAKVRRVLEALKKAGLHLDPGKCEFEVKTIKYLGFIITAGKGVSCDPEKLRAIREWSAPESVKGIRSFLGFANYYRIFIKNFSGLTVPLTALTKKGVAFRWEKAEEAAFQEIKRRFLAEPMLRHWDPDRPTTLETDCSGFATGGILSQEDAEGRHCVIAYHSRKLTPAEYNYEIHDKEMLAIICCLEAWAAELHSCSRFKILTDHRNLQYFMTRRQLTERQSRWAGQLASFDFELRYRKGSLNTAADALSRREQDRPRDFDDEREQGRCLQLIPEQALRRSDPLPRVRRLMIPRVPGTAVFASDPELQELWDQAVKDDAIYRRAYAAVATKERSFPARLSLKVGIDECRIVGEGPLTFRDRIWIPSKGEECTLRTRIIQKAHDSPISGHPGRDNTLAILTRQFFWPGMGKDVRRFVRNCDGCNGGHIWRQAKRGLLKPLPIPQRIHSDLAMDFITDLPPTGPEGAQNMWVITDRLGKNTTLERMETMEAEACAERFLQCHYRFHGFPRSIVSDRGSNWTSRFWRRLCKLTGIDQRLSTAYHPQTDGATERINQEVEAYLRIFTCYAQSDWGDLLPGAMLALNNREHSAIKMSPFFLNHGYNVTPIALAETTETAEPALHEKEQAANALVSKMQEAVEYAQAALAAAQDRYEESANARRKPAERFEVGDKVWLSMANYRTPRPSKKLDWLHHKYTVTRVLGSHTVELDVPSAIHPRFHVDLLRRAGTDPLPGQQQDNWQPPAVRDADGDEEWHIEKILCARWWKQGRKRIRQALVKWLGYREPTWEPTEGLQETAALEEFENRHGPIATNDGPLQEHQPERRRRGERTRR